MQRNLIILPDGTEIFSGVGTEIAIQSVSDTKTVNSGTELTLGSVCSSMIEAKIFTPNGNLNISAGTEITAYKVDDAGKRTKVGLFTLEKPTRPSANTYKLVAYDRVSWLDKDLSEWFSNLTEWPYKLYDFASMICEECGLVFKNDSIPNGDYEIQQFNAYGITGRNYMQKIGEACCRFGRATPDGEFEFAWYEDTGKSFGVSDYFINGLTYEDYETYPIEKVQIKQTENDVGVIWPNSTEASNTYVIAGNYLLTANTTEDLQSVAETIFNELSTVSYTPCKCIFRAPSGINPGDIIQITDRNGVTIKTYVMSHKTKGQKETIECFGSYRRDSVTRVNNQSFETLSGKVYELETSVSGLIATNRDLEGRVTQIKQDTESIIASALEEYVKTGDFETFKETVSSEIAVMADKVSISVSESVRQEIKDGDDSLLALYNELRMNYDFTADGQYIGKKDSDTMMRLVNDMMQILVSGVAATTVDKSGLTADEANIRTLHMGEYTLALGNDNHLMLT